MFFDMNVSTISSISQEIVGDWCRTRKTNTFFSFFIVIDTSFTVSIKLFPSPKL